MSKYLVYFLVAFFADLMTAGKPYNSMLMVTILICVLFHAYFTRGGKKNDDAGSRN